MDMKLYYFPGACSLASHIVLEWVGASYDAVRMSEQTIKQAEYLSINPEGTVPLLVSDCFQLIETVAILGYLADLHPEAGLLGDGTARGRAEVMRWLAFLNIDVYKAFKQIFTPSRYVRDPAAHTELAATARGFLRTAFERLDSRLKARAWLADQRSVADAYMFVMLRWAASGDVPVRDLENVARFAVRMQEDVGVRTAIAQEEG
jgi:glutathione S-transferase